MTIEINPKYVLEIAKEVKNLQHLLAPNDSSVNCGFYLMNFHTLYLDDELDNEIVGELDKGLCRFFGDHAILQKWSELHRCRLDS